MKKSIFLFYIFVGLFLAEGTAFAGVPVELSSEKVSQGSVLFIRVFDKTAKSVKIKETTFPLFESKDGVSKGVLIGVPARWNSGERYPVEVDEKTTGKAVEVEEKSRKLEILTIEKSKLVSNEETAKQGKVLLAAISSLKIEKLWNGNFLKPVEGMITTEYGTRRTVNGKKGGVHRGVDIGAEEGTVVKAANNGIIAISRNHILTGNTIVLNHGAGLVSVYYHMSELTAKENQKIKKGEVIGKVGSTGVSTGAHLHWGIWIFGVDVDPFELIKKEIDF